MLANFFVGIVATKSAKVYGFLCFFDCIYKVAYFFITHVDEMEGIASCCFKANSRELSKCSNKF